MSETQAFSNEFYSAMLPEMLLFAGLIALIIIPNLGKGTFRIPGTQIRLPWFMGGQRFGLTSNPHLPAWIATITLAGAFAAVADSLNGGVDSLLVVSSDSDSAKELLMVNGFSRVFELIFFGALALASFASMNRLKVEGTGGKLTEDQLFNNRRQADFYILMLTC